MMDANEVLTLLVCVTVALFGAAGRLRIQSLPHWGLFLASFSLLSAAALFTVLEGFVFYGAFNGAEHLCYAGSAIALLLWATRVYPSVEGTAQ